MSTPATALESEKALDVERVHPVEIGSQGQEPWSVEYIPGSIEEKRLVRKVDFRLIPPLWVMYVCNSIDRSNIGNAKTAGMSKDLHLSSSDYSLILSIFFVGYLIAQVPSNILLSRWRPSLYLPGMMFIWGCLTIAVQGINSLGGMIGYRIVLGMVEAGFYPGVVFVMSCWYTPSEISKRVAVWYTANYLSGAFSGVLAGLIVENLDGVSNVRGWKWLFIIEGVITCGMALLSVFIMPDFPQTTKWLTPDERKLATARLAIPEEDDLQEVSLLTSLKLSFKDPIVWSFLVMDFCTGSYGTVSYFYPTIVSALGYKGTTAQFMTVPIYMTTLVFALLMAWNADRTGRKGYHVMASCVLGGICFLICLVTTNNQVRYAFLVLGVATGYSGYPVLHSWIAIMFEGRGRRAISIALINGISNCTSIYGSFYWPTEDGPRFIMGFSITLAWTIVGFLIASFNTWKFGDSVTAKGRRC